MQSGDAEWRCRVEMQRGNVLHRAVCTPLANHGGRERKWVAAIQEWVLNPLRGFQHYRPPGGLVGEGCKNAQPTVTKH